MLDLEENDRLTRVECDQPAGKLLREYWMPAALSEELAVERPVIAVRLFGEDLVLFRDQSGELGLIQRRCPHRGVDLCYARREAEGLRCPFHGWYFDRLGNCLEQPAEPPTSTMHTRIKATAYPVVERNGIIWTYMGSAEPPPFANFDCFRAPSTHVFAFKGLWACNWLQATEIGIDPAHASYLHRFLVDDTEDESYGQQFRDTADQSQIPMTRLLREYPQPSIEIAETGFGMRIFARRQLSDGQVHTRVTNHIFPCAISIPMSNEMNITQWHVPVDDYHTYWYSMFTSYGEPVDKTTMREQRMQEHRLPDYAPIKSAANNYGYDPAEQQGLTYTGMGMDINVHDQWAVESMGAIQDRSRENLASSDRAIIHARKRLRDAMTSLQHGRITELPGRTSGIDTALNTGPIAIDVISPAKDQALCWTERDELRRAACTWDSRIPRAS